MLTEERTFAGSAGIEALRDSAQHIHTVTIAHLGGPWPSFVHLAHGVAWDTLQAVHHWQMVTLRLGGVAGARLSPTHVRLTPEMGGGERGLRATLFLGGTDPLPGGDPPAIGGSLDVIA